MPPSANGDPEIERIQGEQRRRGRSQAGRRERPVTDQRHAASSSATAVSASGSDGVTRVARNHAAAMRTLMSGGVPSLASELQRRAEAAARHQLTAGAEIL